jgi:hypothetical protein
VITIATHLIFHSPTKLNLHFQLVLAHGELEAAADIVEALTRFWDEVNGSSRHTWLNSVKDDSTKPIKYLTGLQIARASDADPSGVEPFLRMLYRVRLIESYGIKRKQEGKLSRHVSSVQQSG